MVALDSNKKTVPQQPGHAAATAAVAAAMDARTASAHAARTRRQRHGGGDGQAAVAQGQTDKHANERKHSRAKKADSTLRSSQAVPHPSTNRALRCLTSEVEGDPVHSTRYSRRRRSGSTPTRTNAQPQEIEHKRATPNEQRRHQRLAKQRRCPTRAQNQKESGSFGGNAQKQP